MRMANRVRLLVVCSGLAGLLLGALGTAAVQGEQPASPASSGRKIIRPEKAPNTGLPYSSGILAGNTLYIAGHLGRDPVTSNLVSGGIEPETRQVLANIREVLRGAGMDFKDVVSVTAYITDFKDFAAFNKVYREAFPTDPPTRATVGVASLNVGAHIELQMIAVK
jgi:2-iminobutanoate/2-iminopropanoate deaminase